MHPPILYRTVVRRLLHALHLAKEEERMAHVQLLQRIMGGDTDVGEVRSLALWKGGGRHDTKGGHLFLKHTLELC